MIIRREKKLSIIFIFIMIAVLLLATASCSSEEASQEDGQDEVAEEPQEEQSTEDDSEDESTDENMENEESSEGSENSENEQVDAESILSNTEEPEEYYYEQTVATGGGETYTSKFWFKNDKMKVEGEEGGVPYIVIWTDEYFVNLDTQSKIAYKSVIEDNGEGTDGFETGFDSMYEDDFDFEEFEEDEAEEIIEYIGKDTVNGEPCFLFETSISGDNTVNKVWIHQDYGIVMKSETTGGTSDMNYTMEVTDFQIGDVSDDEFVIPEDYEIMEY
jgi:outer membrane lipoprotein-sorting protein